MGILKKFKGVFFGTGKLNVTKSNFKDIADNYALYKPMIVDILKEITTPPNLTDSDSDNITQMYDYFANYDGSIDLSSAQLSSFAGGIQVSMGSPDDTKIDATPLSVLEELETVPTPFTLNGLDEKIQSFKDKLFISSQRYTVKQLEGFIKRLENRKSYRDKAEFFLGFPNTTDDKIDQLLSKYKLAFQTSDLFIPTFPTEAVDIMKRYTEVTIKITGEKPVYYVIAEEKDFRKKFKKNDPILLVQSPFGFYWQILGAWDKEMLLLSEL